MNDPAPGTPLVSFVLVNWRTQEATVECARSIAQLEGDFDREIIISDNESTPESRAVLARIDATVLPHAGNTGFTGGVNAALDVARGDVVAIVNNDCVLAPDWAAVGLAFLDEHPSAGIVGGREFLWDHENPLGDESNAVFTVTHFAPRTGSHTRLRTDVPTCEVFSLDGSNLLVRAALLRELGGFDPDFFAYYEDLDLCARAGALGHGVHYCRDMRIWHHRHLSSDRVPFRRVFLAHRNHLMVVAKHFPDRQWSRVVVEECLIRLIHAATGRQAVIRGRRSAPRLDRAERLAAASASLWGLTHLARLRRTRRRSVAGGQHDPHMLARRERLERARPDPVASPARAGAVPGRHGAMPGPRPGSRRSWAG